MSVLEIRGATPADVGTLLRLIRALAEFEHASDQVMASEADLLRDGFGPVPRFEARLAWLAGQPVGFTLFFATYSTWEGRPGLYLEDIYVEERARRHGVGRALIVDLARLALARDYRRLDLSVLDWNPARAFYERLGIRQNAGWLPYRISGPALAALAKEK
ncbi:MAG TPA: GNAT family N-acetyltransferase [Stellaceae bacterium]|nr:GNAT family N-acetyltransferase [Stellaceae bacterium]